MPVRRITRDRLLSKEEAEKYRKIREEIEKELPSLIERFHKGEGVPLGTYFATNKLLAGLKKEREAAGLSLADMASRTGMDRAVISKLENGHQENPTIETLQRYAAALGKRITLGYVDMESAEKENS